jgi:Sec-independent protein translocase protein TatA
MSDKKNVEEILAELGQKIDKLISETKKAGSKVSAEMEEQIQKMKERKEKVEEDFKKSTASSGEKWEHAKLHLNEAAIEIRRAFETMFKK